MRILVTGASGMLGSTLVEQWRTRHDVRATGGPSFTPPASWSYRAFDLGEPDHAPLIAWAEPDVIVHCAAITSVDACEAAPEHTLDINGRSVEGLLAAAPGARMLYISSDAVLGRLDRPAREDAIPAPLNVYGRSKQLGETLLGSAGVAVRTTVVGWNRDPRKQSFVEWIVRSLQRKTSITMFEDALFTPIAAADLGVELEGLLDAPFRGILHVTGRESISKYEFAVLLCDRLGLDRSLLRPGRMADVQLAAARSADQRLDVSRFEAIVGRHLPTIAVTIETLALEAMVRATSSAT